MGAVQKEIVDRYSYHGDICATYVIYIYCDNCGSFNIRKVLSLRQWLLVIGSCLLLATILAFLVIIRYFDGVQLALDVEAWIALFSILIIMSLVVYGLWGKPAYRCRRCGKRTTSRYHTRVKAPVGEVGVPEKLKQKYYLTGWPDDQSIETYLTLPVDIKRKKRL